MHAIANKSRNGNRQNGDTRIAAESLEAAEDAGLRYVGDDQPGFSRQRKGEEFEYLDQKGKPIRDEQRLLRLLSVFVGGYLESVFVCVRLWLS